MPDYSPIENVVAARFPGGRITELSALLTVNGDTLAALGWTGTGQYFLCVMFLEDAVSFAKFDTYTEAEESWQRLLSKFA